MTMREIMDICKEILASEGEPLDKIDYEWELGYNVACTLQPKLQYTALSGIEHYLLGINVKISTADLDCIHLYKLKYGTRERMVA